MVAQTTILLERSSSCSEKSTLGRPEPLGMSRYSKTRPVRMKSVSRLLASRSAAGREMPFCMMILMASILPRMTPGSSTDNIVDDANCFTTCSTMISPA